MELEEGCDRGWEGTSAPTTGCCFVRATFRWRTFSQSNLFRRERMDAFRSIINRAGGKREENGRQSYHSLNHSFLVREMLSEAAAMGNKGGEIFHL